MRIIPPGRAREAAARKRDEPQRQAMASLLVDALGLGTGKQERAEAAEIFAAFGLDLHEMDRAVRHGTPDRARVLRQAASTALGAAAPSTGSIVAELARVSGLLVAMATEVYELLAEHSATTTGTTERFTLAPADLGAVEMTLSPGFFEDVTRMISEVVVESLAALDHHALADFLWLDNGVPYGHWPLTRGTGGFALPAGVLRLATVRTDLEHLAAADSRWEAVAAEARQAHQAAARLVGTAERLVTVYAEQLTRVAEAAPPGAPRGTHAAEQVVASAPGGSFGPAQAAAEVDLFLTTGRLGGTVVLVDDAGRARAHDVSISLGPAGDGRRRIEPTTSDRPSSAVAGLASWCVMFREGVVPGRRQDELGSSATPEAWSRWLSTLAVASQEATSWMEAMLHGPGRGHAVERTREDVVTLLNLPLWRHRDLLYEVWLLVATMRACEHAGADLELTGLDPDSHSWVLPVSRASGPVAHVVFRPGGERLGIWREPLRHAPGGGDLTPDVTISVPGPTPRDLVVVEAKDRVKMAEAAAVTVGRKYADALSPRLTWVGNHCEFRLRTDRSPAAAIGRLSHGDPWSPILLAGRLRPGSVPAAFTDTIVEAIRPTRGLGPGS